MRFSTKFASVLLSLVGGALLLASGPAQAAPAIGVDQVVGTLGLAPEPADYVLLVDTSGSMNQGGRYSAVRSQLRRLLAGLRSEDRVSLLTFDSTVVKRYRGDVGTNPDAVLTHLPATATGIHTDIGAAIEGGLMQLEIADTHRLAALILITDGVLDTVPSAKYANVGSASWRKLKTRAGGLEKSHQLAAYAVSLSTTTDAGLLKKVVPLAKEIRADEVGARFAQVAGDFVRMQAADVLADELEAPIKVAFSGDLGPALAEGATVPLQVSLSSPYPHVPVVLSSVKLQATDGLQLVVTGLPKQISLQPGATANLEVQIGVSGEASSDSTVSLSATVSSPWGKVLEKDLGLRFAPALEGETEVPPAPIKIPPNLLWVAGGVATLSVAVVGLFLVVRMLLTPPMDGVLAFAKNGHEIVDIVLRRRRRQQLVVPVGASELTGLTGSARGARGAVRLDARFGAAHTRSLVADAQSIQLGDITVTYISGRRRILDKIGLPRSGAVGD